MKQAGFKKTRRSNLNRLIYIRRNWSVASASYQSESFKIFVCLDKSLNLRNETFSSVRPGFNKLMHLRAGVISS